MLCPYCRSPLEALLIQGRHTGAWQCLRCKGAWLRGQQISALGPAGPMGLLGAGSIAGSSPAGGPFPAPYHGQPSPGGPGSGFGAGGLSSPWQATTGQPMTGQTLGNSRPGSQSIPRSSPEASSWRAWFGGGKSGSSQSAAQTSGQAQNPDWDVCTWCGKARPGMGAHCIHCNIERMRCPECQVVLTGVRRHQVLVDLCLRCQGIWFEKGRLEALLDALRGDAPPPVQHTSTQGPPSLLQQLATFLEQTEPGSNSERHKGEVGIWDALASTFSSGVGGSRQVLYDLLTLMGDLQKPGDKSGERSSGEKGAGMHAGKPQKPR